MTTTAEENKLLDIIDFDLEELELLPDFEVPPAGVYEFVTTQLGTREAKELKQGQDQKTMYAVAGFKLTKLVEQTDTKKTPLNLDKPLELSMSMQLNNYEAGKENGYAYMQSNFRKFLAPFAAFIGTTKTAEMAPKYPGITGKIVITNRSYTDSAGDKKESWGVKTIMIDS